MKSNGQEGIKVGVSHVLCNRDKEFGSALLHLGICWVMFIIAKFLFPNFASPFPKKLYRIK